MKFNLLIILIFGISFSSISQIDPTDIEIVRDSFGVPHIYAKTDTQVAYGLAWHMLKMTLKQFNIHT